MPPVPQSDRVMEGLLLMAEKEEEGKSKGGGWFKAILGTVGGLLSGAVVMYFGAWVDQAVKPAKPVPNFRVEHEGATVHFQNLSLGFRGWWDFGDGTELVPADTAHDSVAHKYDRPGDYNVKLSLSNLLGEENDRTVSLHVEDAPASKQPKIVSLTAERQSPGVYAPAMYKVTAKTENALLCILNLDNEQQAESINEGTASLERWVTFDKPGTYDIDFFATNDKLTDQKRTSVSVQAPPAGTINALLTTVDAGTLVQTRKQPCTFSDMFRADVKGDASPLSGRELFAASPRDKDKDWIIRDVHVTGAGSKDFSLGDKTELPLDSAAMGLQNARNLRMQLSADRRSVHMLGEITRGPAKDAGPPPTVMLQGSMTQELRKPDTRTVPLPATLVIPAVGLATSETIILPPPPAEWVDPQPRKLHLAVRDGATMLAQDVPIPGQVEVTLQKRRCMLSAVPIKDRDGRVQQVRLDLADAPIRPAGK